MIEDYQDAVDYNPEHLHFKCSVDNNKYEEIITYNDFLKYISKADDDPVVWKFKKIT